jgi:hypothetical protein
MKKVFLGGTCNESTWRDTLIPMLKVEYFNPVVEDWTPECQDEEIKQRENCDYVLYTLTPDMIGVYSIAEVVEDSIKRPSKTIFCVLQFGNKKRFERDAMKSMVAVGEMVERNGGIFVVDDLDHVADILNGVFD